LAALDSDTIGVLASGGLDSSILIGDLVRRGRRVQPFYVRTGLYWQAAEQSGLEQFLGAMATKSLQKLIVFELPLADLYSGHWSLTGDGTPEANSPDEAVFLPGRNALLLLKPAVWCQLQGIQELGWAALGTSPFDDASAGFLHDFEAAINRGSRSPVHLLLPFGNMNKQEVMRLGGEMPLELTFSCIAPVRGLHCGRCNKCAERRQAFEGAGLEDRTVYA
jgi:7-cyano-7-deazaguanine synthase